MPRSRPNMGSGKGKRRSGSGTPNRTNTVGSKKGPGMDRVLKGEKPSDPEAEIEAKRSDEPTEALPADTQAVRKGRGR